MINSFFLLLLQRDVLTGSISYLKYCCKWKFQKQKCYNNCFYRCYSQLCRSNIQIELMIVSRVALNLMFCIYKKGVIISVFRLCDWSAYHPWLAQPCFTIAIWSQTNTNKHKFCHCHNYSQTLFFRYIAVSDFAVARQAWIYCDDHSDDNFQYLVLNTKLFFKCLLHVLHVFWKRPGRDLANVQYIALITLLT